MCIRDSHFSKIKELKRGHALIVKKSGKIIEEPYIKLKPSTPCSFERIYFSRGTDRDIYLERKQLGEQLTESVMKEVNYDFENTVFSFVPNTAESSFYGLVDGVYKCLNQKKKEKILKLGNKLTPKKLEKILSLQPRVEKTVVKDAKLRTFIADDASRGEMVAHVYDVTYGIINNEVDTLVLVDDSIVRGTTLRDSILRIAARLRPKKIVVVSSAPQIRYPDCYGIDMSVLGNFVAFKALIALIKENGKQDMLQQVYKKCKKQEHLPKKKIKNYVKDLYALFSYEEVSDKIAEIVTPKEIKPEVKVIYQKIKGLHKACPKNSGDWYFSGDYPTPGGNRVVNMAFINYMEDRNVRAY